MCLPVEKSAIVAIDVNSSANHYQLHFPQPLNTIRTWTVMGGTAAEAGTKPPGWWPSQASPDCI
jgi:hypothetical protein